MPDLVGIFGKLDALALGFAGIVEQAEFNLGGMGGKQREVDAESIPGGAERKRSALGDPGAAQARGRPRQGVV